MTAVIGNAAGFIAKAYYATTIVSDKTLANIEALVAGTDAATGLEIPKVSEMGSLDKTREIIDITVYGQDVASKLPGQADPGTFDFTVTLNFDDDVHVAIRDDEGKLPYTFVIEFEQTAAAVSYACFDGYIANANVSQGANEAISMEVSIARDGAIVWANKA